MRYGACRVEIHEFRVREDGDTARRVWDRNWESENVDW